jgi:hypothetical protein
LIGLKSHLPGALGYDVLGSELKDGFEQQLIVYENEGNKIPAYLLIPDHAE